MNSFGDEIIFVGCNSIIRYCDNGRKEYISNDFSNLDRANIKAVSFCGLMNSEGAAEISKYDDWGIEKIDLDGVNQSRWFSFRNLRKLKSVRLNTIVNEDNWGVFDLAENSFYNCSMEELVIPDACIHVYANAINKCDKLKRVVIQMTGGQIFTNAFHDCYNIKEVELYGDSLECSAHAFPFEVTSGKNPYSTGEPCKLYYHYDYLKREYYVENEGLKTQCWIADYGFDFQKNYIAPRMKFFQDEYKKGKTYDEIVEEIRKGEFFDGKYKKFGGFNEFLHDGPSYIPKDSLRLYCDRYARKIPKTGARVFILNYKLDEECTAENRYKDKYYHTQLREIHDVIPANTGVLIYASDSIILDPIYDETPPYTWHSEGKLKNYFASTINNSGKSYYIDNRLIPYYFMGLMQDNYDKSATYTDTLSLNCTLQHYTYSYLESENWKNRSHYYFGIDKNKGLCINNGYAYMQLPTCLAYRNFYNYSDDEVLFKENDEYGRIVGLEIADDETSSIDNVSSEEQIRNKGKWFTSDGIELPSTPTKSGIYIYNGKKYLITK